MVQQLGCPMLRYLSETTDEEKLHVRRGTIDLLASHMKMRFVAPGIGFASSLTYNLWFVRLVVMPICTPGGRQGNCCT